MSTTDELLALNKRLLDSIVAGNWKAYEELCAPKLTCFEPEARGHIVEGLAFHKFYFDLGGATKSTNTTMVEPVVHLLGDDAAVVAYLRLTQKLDVDGKPITTVMEETRVWQRTGGRWRHVHFHRSAPG
jgi:calcium/calmodulin-dependent protein kinase (CaM kinase) II